MDEASLKEFLEANAESIKATVKEAAINKLLEQHRWNISEQISTVVNAFVKDQVIPEVTAALAENKGMIVEAAISAVANIGKDLSEALTLSAAKNVKDDWKRKDICKAIFGY